MQNPIAQAGPSEDGKMGWKEFWGDPNSEKLDRVTNVVVESHEEFFKRITKIDRNLICKLGQSELEELMSENLKVALERKTRHHQNKGFFRETGHNAVKFTKNILEYFEAYSGIVEIMKGADQQYGGVAYATISLLLIVAINKDTKERCIDETLRTLQREFIRVQTVKHIHDSPTMQDLICDAFVESILFLRWATRYYAQKSWHRVTEAFIKPPKIELDQLTANIARAVAEIEKERDALDSKRLFEVRAELGDVRRRLEDVEARDEGGQLYQLKEMIASPIENRAERLTEYEVALKNAFRNLRRFKPFEMSMLEGQETYQVWSRNSSSSLLLLYGRTRAHAGHCCWLSPALLAIKKETEGQRKAFGWFCCQKDATLVDQVPITAVVRDFIDQLLEQGRPRLRNQAWYEVVLRYAKAVSNGRQDVNAHFELLQKVSESFADVILVIDRSDLVKGEPWNWLRHFAKLIKSSPHNIRVLLIASSNGNTEPNGKLEPHFFTELEEELRHRFLSLELNDSC